MKIKKICIISQYYPTETDMIFSFVDELVSQFADKGIECHVITPLSRFGKLHRSTTRIKVTDKGNTIRIYCPLYTTYPHRKLFGKDTYRLQMASYISSIEKILISKIGEVNVLYAHFLNPSGIAAAIIGKKYNIPVYVASGESSFEPHQFSYELYKDEIRVGISGVITVSSKIKRELVGKKLFNNEVANAIKVFPNAVDLSLFRKISKEKARKALGIDNNLFIISFVGHFNERKGISRLVSALERNSFWHGIFIGEGELEPSFERTVFQGSVAHNDLPLYLSASDIFALPTLAEGCCNAIIEALACGLPVISSNKPFNDDILDDTCSIQIDSMDVDQIYNAIDKLWKDKNVRSILSSGALEKANGLDLSKRADKIVSFMEG